jgi:hypothetical protein
LDIENTGSQPLASAFFKLPNLVCRRSEGPLPAHSANTHGHHHERIQQN